MNVVTRSGTNAIHGTAFDFLRNQDLNARNFFSATADGLKRNQFGASLGGPVLKDRLFYFVSYQGTRSATSSTTSSAYVLTAAERMGDFSAVSQPLTNPLDGGVFPGNRIPLSYLNPVPRISSNSFLWQLPRTALYDLAVEALFKRRIRDWAGSTIT